MSHLSGLILITNFGFGKPQPRDAWRLPLALCLGSLLVLLRRWCSARDHNTNVLCAKPVISLLRSLVLKSSSSRAMRKYPLPFLVGNRNLGFSGFSDFVLHVTALLSPRETYNRTIVF